MAGPGNGKARTSGNGPTSGATPRAPRRIVLLAGGEDSAVQQVLAEFAGPEVTGTRLHEDVRRLAAEYPGHVVAGEWQGPLGWVRFVWCRKEPPGGAQPSGRSAASK